MDKPFLGPLRFKHEDLAQIPTLKTGEPFWAKDTETLLIGKHGDTPVQMAKYSDVTGLLIDEDSFVSDLATKCPSQQSVKAYVGAHILDEDDFASNSATLPPSQQSAKAYVDGKGFVDRGDPAAWDVELAALTTDGTWRDLDLSAIVPAGAKAVLLRADILDDAAGNTVSFRENGNANTYNSQTIYTQVANVAISVGAVVSCDANRVIEYFATNTTWSAINILVRGWWL